MLLVGNQSCYLQNSLDENFGSVQLLLKGNAPEASTTIKDYSPSAWSQTAVNLCQNTSTQSKFEGFSIFQAGDVANAQVTYPVNAMWGTSSFGNNKWTIETWFYLPSGLYGTYNSCEISSPSGNIMNISIFPTYIGVYTGNGSIFTPITSGEITAGTWHYVAICKNTTANTATTSNYDVYLNGTRRTTTSAPTWKSIASQNFLVGRADGAPRPPKYFDDYRLTIGVNRYTGSTMTLPDRSAGIAKR